MKKGIPLVGGIVLGAVVGVLLGNILVGAILGGGAGMVLGAMLGHGDADRGSAPLPGHSNDHTDRLDGGPPDDGPGDSADGGADPD